LIGTGVRLKWLITNNSPHCVNIQFIFTLISSMETPHIRMARAKIYYGLHSLCIFEIEY